MDKKVLKRDGSTEAYEEAKVVRVVQAAGLPDEQAKALAAQVSTWIRTVPDASVSSLLIRDKVLSLLLTADANVADFYRWYEKTKDVPRKKIKI